MCGVPAEKLQKGLGQDSNPESLDWEAHVLCTVTTPLPNSKHKKRNQISFPLMLLFYFQVAPVVPPMTTATIATVTDITTLL